MLFIYLVFKVHLGDDILIGIQIRLNQSIKNLTIIKRSNLFLIENIFLL